MAKPAKTIEFKTTGPQKETPMDKTTRIVRDIQDGETKQREIKTTRLRNARLQSEAGTPVEVITATSNRTRKKPPAKAIK